MSLVVVRYIASRFSAHTTADGWVRFDRRVVAVANLVTILLFACFLHFATFFAFLIAYAVLVFMKGLQAVLIIRPYHALTARLTPNAHRRHTGALIALQAASSLALCGSLALAGWLIASALSVSAGHLLIALAITAAACLAQDCVRRILFERGEPRAAALNDALTRGLQVFGALVLVEAAAVWASAGNALWVLGLSSACGLALGCWQLKKHVRFEWKRDGSYLRIWARIRDAGKSWSAHYRQWVAGFPHLATRPSFPHPSPEEWFR